MASRPRSSTSRADCPVPRPSYSRRRRWRPSASYARRRRGMRHCAATLLKGTGGSQTTGGPEPLIVYAIVTPSLLRAYWMRGSTRHRSHTGRSVEFCRRQSSSFTNGTRNWRSPFTGSGGSSMAAQVIHVEVTGSDGEALQRFYRDVFGWNLDTNNPGGYGMYRQDNGITGGIGAAGNGQPPGVKFYV